MATSLKQKWSRGLLCPLLQVLVVSTKEASPGELLLLKMFLSMKKHQILQSDAQGPPCRTVVSPNAMQI